MGAAPGAPVPPPGSAILTDEHDDDRPAVANDAGDTSPESGRPSETDIRMRAYERYVARGRFDGGDFDDWLLAEAELKSRR